jgi:predicted acyltransferase
MDDAMRAAGRAPETLYKTEGTSLHALLFNRVFTPLASPVNASLAYAIADVLVWWAVMWTLYRRNIQLRV